MSRTWRYSWRWRPAARGPLTRSSPRTSPRTPSSRSRSRRTASARTSRFRGGRGRDVADGAVGSAAVADNSLGGQKIEDGSLNGADIANGGLGSQDIANGGITGADLAGDSVTGAKVQDGSLGGGDIADGSLSGADVIGDSLTGADIDESSLSGLDAATLGGLGRVAIAKRSSNGFGMLADDPERAALTIPGLAELRLNCDSAGTPTSSIEVRNLLPFTQLVFFDREGAADPTVESVAPNANSSFNTNVVGAGTVEQFTFVYSESAVISYQVFAYNDGTDICTWSASVDYNTDAF